MKPRYILIKTQNSNLIKTLIFQIQEIKHIRFFHFKTNGFYTLTIKCHNYYNPEEIFTDNQLYGSYIFLYSLISMLLSDLLIFYYEHDLTNHLLKPKHLNIKDLSKISNISALLLDQNSPLELSEVLYKRRKNYLLDDLFQNFRKRNFIFLDYFLDFNAPKYKEEISKIIEASVEILENKTLYHYMMNFIFQKP